MIHYHSYSILFILCTMIDVIIEFMTVITIIYLFVCCNSLTHSNSDELVAIEIGSLRTTLIYCVFFNSEISFPPSVGWMERRFLKQHKYNTNFCLISLLLLLTVCYQIILSLISIHNSIWFWKVKLVITKQNQKNIYN